VAITIYVPANFVFTSPTVIKVVVHETTTIIHKVVRLSGPSHTPEYLLGQKYGSIDGTVGIYDLVAACSKFTGTDFDHCKAGYYEAFVETCVHSKFGCDGVIQIPKSVCTKDNMTCPPPKPPFTCNSPGYNGTCPTNMTATTSTPSGTNMTTNMSSTASKPTATNFTVPGSGGKGSGSTCAAGNCTAGTTLPPVDCTKNPNDPSCTQTLTPPSPTTKTCPDGSVIDASASCPTQSTPPSISGTPPNNNPSPPPSNNPSPPSSSNNGGGGSGTGSGGSGSGSSGSRGGSNPSQPTTVN
jgi:uncharacterized membrane protein YgcG